MVVEDLGVQVLAARLSDARFFWQQDLKKSLAVHAEGLKRITFHEKLGTVADKVERVAKLAGALRRPQPGEPAWRPSLTLGEFFLALFIVVMGTLLVPGVVTFVPL